MSTDYPPIFAGPPVVQDAAPPSAPPDVHLDPRWEWIEVAQLGRPGPDYVRGRCNHLEVVPVESVNGETVAHLCQTCDTQLPAERRVQLDNNP